MYKILIPFNNTLDGTIINPNSGNEYRDILSFENESVKAQYIDMFLFDNKIGDYKQVIKDYNYNVDLIWNDENSASLSVNVDKLNKNVNGIDFVYDLEDLIQKDFIIVYNELKDNFWFFSITGAISDKNNVSIAYSLEINEFWNNDFKNMFQGDIEINSGQVNRNVNNLFTGIPANTYNFSENEEINYTWDSYDTRHQLKPINSSKIEEIYGIVLDYTQEKFYNLIVSKTLWVYLKIKQTDTGESFKVYNGTNSSFTENDYIEIPGTLYVAPLNQAKKIQLVYVNGPVESKTPFDINQMIKVAGHANIESMYISNMVPFDISRLDIRESKDTGYYFDIYDVGSKPISAKFGAIYLNYINPYINSIYNVKSLDLSLEAFQIKNISDKITLSNETGARHNKQFHVSSIYSDNTFKIPPYLYGNTIYFRTLTTNFDGNEETFLKAEYIKTNSGALLSLNYGTGIGFKENINTMIPAANDTYEEMRINNKSSLALKSASSALGLLAAPAVAYKNPIAGVGMAFGAVSYAAKIADMKRAPSNITNFSADVIHKYANLIYFNYFNCVVKQPTGNGLEMKQWDCILNGSKINVLHSSPFISERYYFNKIDYSNVYSNINLNIAPKRKQIIADSCESGDLTVWHVRDLSTFKGIKNYQYENLEMDLVKKNETKRD